ncbi:hypothetical protein QRX50_37880 [Amycolatopsis carbonis]|uniref:Uncharacterized protein n=1 Tax=Amycolatopsis carbonis TaxID=715471 RepID=A0A9Y2ICC0_9PSEU|nr:hypothetical protein [Amycolatopsis sp. 2-15]WIX77132.1 hypothetical protein QRX50_37880 [Amycolatopsis sp. 2-15]
MRNGVRRGRVAPLLGGAVVVMASLAGGGCGSIRLEAQENKDTVSLSAAKNRDSAALPCAQILAAVTETATLTRPLDGRALTDRSTGAPIQYFDGAALAAIAYLLAGFRFDRDQFDTQSSAAPMGPQTPVAWSRVYTHDGVGDLVVTQALPGSGVLDWPADGTSGVGRMGAQVRRGGSAVGLAWTAGGFEFAVYSEAGNTLTQTALPVSELVRVAESVEL